MALRAFALHSPLGGSRHSIYETRIKHASANSWWAPTSSALVMAISQLFGIGLACWGLNFMLRADDEPLTPKRHSNKHNISSANRSDKAQTSSRKKLDLRTEDEDEKRIEDLDEDEIGNEDGAGYKEDLDDLPPGLRNNGNLCFFNCVLQALASAPSFVDHLTSHPAATSPHCTASVAAALKPLILQLETRSGRRRRSYMTTSGIADAQSGSLDSAGIGVSAPPPRVLDGSVVVRRLLQAVNEASHEERGSESLFGRRGLQAQQDAQELMQTLVETLQREWARNTAASGAEGHGAPSLRAALDMKLAVLSSQQGPFECSSANLHGASAAMRLVAPCPLTGWFGTAATCLGPCKRARPVAQSAFTSVPLSLAETVHDHAIGSAVQLESLLESFTRREVMAGVDCEDCTRAARIDQLRTTCSFLESSVQRLRSTDGKTNSSNDSSASEDDEAELSRELAATQRALKRLLASPQRCSKQRVARDHCKAGNDSKATDCSKDEEIPEGPVVGDDEVRVKSHLSRRMLFTRLPPVLVFHVGRQTYNRNTGAAVKLRTAINYPETLDMRRFTAYGGSQWEAVRDPTSGEYGKKKRGGLESAPSSSHDCTTTATSPTVASNSGSSFASDSSQSEPKDLTKPSSSSFLYDCCACVIHHGGNDGTTGHYTTFRRLDWGANSKTNTRWAHASDAQVAEVPEMSGTMGLNGETTRHRSEAFLLVYSLRPNTQQLLN